MIERTSPTKPWMKDYTFVLIQSLEELEDVITRAIENKRCAFDLESTGLDTRVFNGKCNSEIVGYSFCFEPKIGYYVPIRHKIETVQGKNLDPVEVNKQIKRLLDNCSLIGHNWLKYDIEIMYASENIDIRKINPGEEFPHHDTYIIARLAGMQPAGLKWLSKSRINKEMLEITDIVPNKNNIDFSSVSPYEGYIYAASDAICTNELFDLPEFQEAINSQKLVYSIERKLAKVVRKLERNKVKLDTDFCRQLDSELLGSISDIEKSIFDEVSEKSNGQISQFQLDSPDEVSNVLFNIYDMNPKPEKGKKGNYKTDDEVLEKLAVNYPLAKKMQEYRTLTKFHRTYIKNMILNVDKDGYLKFNFSQLKTDSGRFASPGKNDEGVHGDGYSGVNVQSTPARYDKSKPNVRKCISCEQDEVIAALDWSGVEIRVACNMSREPIWLERFLNGDGDLHTSTASIIYDKPESEVTKEERQTGKCVDPKSILYVNGRYVRIGDLHKSRDVDTFYNLEQELNVKISENENSKIKQFYSNGPGEKLLVCYRRGVLACSKNHRIELADGTLVRAEDIQEGMVLKDIEFVVEPKNPIVSQNNYDHLGLDGEIADEVLNGDYRSKKYFISSVFGKSDTFVTDNWVLAQDVCVILASSNYEYHIIPVFCEKQNRYQFEIKLRWVIEDIPLGLVIQENKVTKVIPIGTGDLVDIGIEHKDHIYMVNGIRTHNTFNFQSVYGGGPGALSSTIGISMEDAKEKQQKFFGKLQTLKTFIKTLQSNAEKAGYCLTKFGRKRMLPEFKSEFPKIKANAARKATNTPIQGTAADLMKLAMIAIDSYIEDNNLTDKIQMLLTMHDELVFRIKKTHIDRVKDIEKVMQLEEVIKKIKWEVPLKVDVEIGSSWDVKYEYGDMAAFLKETYGVDNVSYIYEPGKNYEDYYKQLSDWKEKKKKEKSTESKIDSPKANKSFNEFKEIGNKLLEEKVVTKDEKKEPKKETVSSIEKTASAEEIDEAFAILKSINLSDLPEEAYLKLKKSFYDKEVKRLMAGKPSVEDKDVETIITVHAPIDESKKFSLGHIIESCPGSGKVKFVTKDKEDLHDDWMHLDLIRVSVMCKIFNI